jgi:hypothetical protein
VGWTLDNFAWPNSLESKTYADANKNGELTDVLRDLGQVESEFLKIGDYPFPPTKANLEQAQRWGQTAAAFFRHGNGKKLSSSLQILRTRAAAAADHPRISAEGQTALTAIRDSCTAHAESISDDVMMPAINATMRKLNEQDKQFVLNSLTKVFASYKACAAKGHPGVQRSRVTLDSEWPALADAEEAARNKIGTDLFSDCRDMTQNVQNLLKAVGHGADLTQFGLDERDIKTLHLISKALVPIANAKSSVVTVGKSKAEIDTLAQEVEANAWLYDEIAKHMP